MPMGSVSLMNLLSKNGFEVAGCNVGMEESMNREFDVAKWLNQHDFKAVTIDLHFNAHSYDAIRLAQISKEVNPNAPVIMGGFTATHFAREIVEGFSDVDVVIKGDAEGSIISVAKKVCSDSHGKLAEIPNVCYRDGDSVKNNPLGYVATAENLNSQDFTDTKFLQNEEKYKRTFFEGYSQEATEDRCWISAGRGCIYSCSYCGGSKMSHYRLCGRKQPVFRSPSRLAEDVARLYTSGVDVVMSSHDLQIPGKKYWTDFFTEVRRQGADIGIYMGIWQLFGRDFLDDLAKTFDLSRSWLVMSPTSGNEAVRRFNGKHYSNHDLLERIHWLKEYEAQLELYFGIHLPKESRTSHDESIKLAKKIQKIFPPQKLKLFCQPIMLDPCCLMSEFPDKFETKPLISSFRDYYENNKKYYEKLRGNEPPEFPHIRYFSHLTHSINNPQEITIMKKKWRDEIYGPKKSSKPSNN